LTAPADAGLLRLTPAALWAGSLPALRPPHSAGFASSTGKRLRPPKPRFATRDRSVSRFTGRRHRS